MSDFILLILWGLKKYFDSHKKTTYEIHSKKF